MKIAVFTDLYLEIAGGIPSSIKAQKKSLEKLGHKVVVFCPGFEQPRDEMVVIVPTCQNIRAGGAPLARRPEIVEDFILRKYPDFKTFDVVHVHYEAGCGLAGMRLARKFGLPLVVTMHGREDMAVATNIPHPFKNLAGIILNKLHAKYVPHRAKVKRDDYLADTKAKTEMWELMVSHANYADVVLVPGMHFAKKLQRYGMIKPTIHLSNGVDDALMKVKLKPRKFEKDEPLRIVWNSRLSKEKRVMPFLKAMKMVEKKYELHIFGDGNEFEKAKKYAEKEGLNARFYGQVERTEIFRAMQKAHISVMASYNFDNQSMTLLESEAMGLPVLFCDPDMKEILPRGGYICADGPRPKELAEAVEKIFEKPEWVERASEILIENRWKVMQAEQTKKLIRAYQGAIKLKS